MQFRLTKLATAVALIFSIAFSSTIFGATAEDVAEGKKIAFDRKLGNCLACHVIAGGELPGNIGPPLIAMKARFPDKSKLRSQIYDATRNNPRSAMPPFGRHGILTDKQIDLVVEFIHSL